MGIGLSKTKNGWIPFPSSKSIWLFTMRTFCIVSLFVGENKQNKVNNNNNKHAKHMLSRSLFNYSNILFLMFLRPLFLKESMKDKNAWRVFNFQQNGFSKQKKKKYIYIYIYISTKCNTKNRLCFV